MRSSGRLVDFLLLAVVVGLTLTTAYIHFWVGGVLLLLNAAGYAALAAAVIGSALVRRALPLVLIALAGYAATTIVGWLIMGPYFDVAYIAKAVEIALIVTISVALRRQAAETRASIAWARSLLGTVVGGGRRPTVPALPAAPTGDE